MTAYCVTQLGGRPLCRTTTRVISATRVRTVSPPAAIPDRCAVDGRQRRSAEIPVRTPQRRRSVTSDMWHARGQEVKWGCVFSATKVDLSPQNETKLMLDLLFILHFTYLGCAYTPNAPPAYGPDCGAIEKHLHTYLLTYRRHVRTIIGCTKTGTNATFH